MNSPHDPIAGLRAAAQLAHHQGRFAEAERSCRAILLQQPNDADAKHQLGVLCLQMGQIGEAVLWLKQAAESSGISAMYWNDLAVALGAAQRHEDAVEAYRRCIAIEPRALQAYGNLGRTLHGLGRDGEAVAILKEAVKRFPQSVEAHIELGVAQLALGKLDDAVESQKAAIKLDPRQPAPYNNLGLALSLQGNDEQAIAHFEKALRVKPDFAAAATNLGNALSRLGRSLEAMRYFEQALRLLPGSAAAHNNFAGALADAGRFEEAVAQYRKAIALDPGYLAAYENLGKTLEALDRQQEALAVYEHLLTLAPNSATARSGKGNTLVALGRFDAARALFEETLAETPRVASTHRALAQLKNFQDGDPQISLLEDMASNDTGLSLPEKADLHFALYKVYSDLKRYEQAFANLEQGNRARRACVLYDEAKETGHLRDLAAAFTPEIVEAKRGLGCQSDVPVFIVGMPRSGSTLMEQMLASHPAVFGAGELPDFAIAAGEGRDAKLSVDPAGLSGSDLNRLGQRYLERIRVKAPDAKRIVDKLLGNFQHAGLIHLALPNARIIHARRSPIDCCFSCYSILFASSVNFSYDLAELGRYYKAYEALMAHWRRVLPESSMLEVSYEELVGDFEAGARRIVEFCGLDWDERCLSFHETERSVRTASATQVRRPIYRNAIERWRPYECQLKPLIDVLEADID